MRPPRTKRYLRLGQKPRQRPQAQGHPAPQARCRSGGRNDPHVMVGDDKTNRTTITTARRRYRLVQAVQLDKQHQKAADQQIPRRRGHRQQPPDGFGRSCRIGPGLRVPGQMGEVPSASTASKRSAVLEMGAGEEQKVLLDRLRHVGRPRKGREQADHRCPQEGTGQVGGPSCPGQTKPRPGRPPKTPAASGVPSAVKYER